MVLDPERLELLDLMPSTCAYLRAREGLPEDELDVAALRIGQRSISEDYVDEEQLADYVVDWIEVGPKKVRPV